MRISSVPLCQRASTTVRRDEDANCEVLLRSVVQDALYSQTALHGDACASSTHARKRRCIECGSDRLEKAAGCGGRLATIIGIARRREASGDFGDMGTISTASSQTNHCTYLDTPASTGLSLTYVHHSGMTLSEA